MTKARSIRDIIDTVQHGISQGRIKGQLATDLDKLCAMAYIGASMSDQLAAEKKHVSVVVVCMNDYPDSVHWTQHQAEQYIAEQKASQPDDRYWHSWACTIGNKVRRL